MKLRNMTTLMAGAVLGLGMAASSASAEFYDGKTVTVLVNYGAGGSTDIEARIVARHLGKHIDGASNVIVKNMPGGGGNIGSNFLGESAPKDGLTVGFFTWNPVDQLIDAPGLRVNYGDFDFVAGISHPTIFYMRKDVEPGMEEPADLLNAERFKAGTYSPTIHQTVRTRLALDLLGVDYQLVTGYEGMAAVNTAMLQDEVQLSNVSLPGYKGGVEPTMVEPGEVMPVFHFDIRGENGELMPNPAVHTAVGDIPSFLELYQAQHGDGAMPSGPEWEGLSLINDIMEQMYRSVLMPPDSPDEAVEEMAAAFQSLSNDPEFIEEYKKTTGVEPSLTLGEAGVATMRALRDVEPEFIEFFKDYVGN